MLRSRQNAAPNTATDTTTTSAGAPVLADTAPSNAAVAEAVAASSSPVQEPGAALLAAVEEEKSKGLRVDWKEKNILAGDVEGRQGGFLIAGAGAQGAEWSTSEGGFTGRIDGKGADVDGRWGKDDRHHLAIDGDFGKSSGSAAYSRKVGDEEIELARIEADAKGAKGHADFGAAHDVRLGLTGDFQKQSGSVSLGRKDGEKVDEWGRIDAQVKDGDNWSVMGHTGGGVADGALTVDAGARAVNGVVHGVGTAGWADRNDKLGLGVDVSSQGAKLSADAAHTFASGDALSGGVAVDHVAATDTGPERTTTSGHLAFGDDADRLKLTGSTDGETHKLGLEETRKAGSASSTQGFGLETQAGNTAFTSSSAFADAWGSLGVKSSQSADASSIGVESALNTSGKGRVLLGLGEAHAGDATTHSGKIGFESPDHGVVLTGSHTSARQHASTLSGHTTLGDTKLTASAGESTADGATTYKGAFGLQNDVTKLSLAGDYLDGDDLGVQGSLSQSFGADKLDLSGSWREKEGAGALDGRIAFVDNEKAEVDGKDVAYVRNSIGLTGHHSDAKQSLGLDYTHGFDPKTSLSTKASWEKVADAVGAPGSEKLAVAANLKAGSFAFGGEGSRLEKADGQTLGLKLDQSYGSPAFRQSAGFTATQGPNGSALDAKAGFDAKLTKDLYLQGYGSLGQKTAADGVSASTWSAGGALTYMVDKDKALTLAAGANQGGGFDARLQFDLLKGKVGGVDKLDDARKKSMISAFVGYSQGGSAGMMDERLGAAEHGARSGGFNAGLTWRF